MPKKKVDSEINLEPFLSHLNREHGYVGSVMQIKKKIQGLRERRKRLKNVYTGKEKQSVEKLFKPSRTCPICGAEIDWVMKTLKDRIRATGKHMCEVMNGTCTLKLWSKKF